MGQPVQLPKNHLLPNFSDVFRNYDFEEIRTSIYAKTTQDVERALYKTSKRSLEDFKALISPAAEPYLEEMAQQAQALTKKRFGKTVQMYIPMYLSNECHNSCTYCGFRRENKIPRTTLTVEEMLAEAKILKSWGFEHILLVTGDFSKKIGKEYLKLAIQTLKPHFAQISMEVQPLDQENYSELIEMGLHAVMVYQETYSPNYKDYHQHGSKKDFFYRLETPDRLGRAGIYKVGVGALLGLEDWRADSWFVGLHLDYLERTYWKSRFSISFPRLRPAPGIQQPKMEMSDKELVQLIVAYRLLSENVELSLSTRESENFRNHVIPLGVTSISAGSKTEPGGYANEGESLEQFEVHDQRDAKSIAKLLQSQGLEAVFKDWDSNYGCK